MRGPMIWVPPRQDTARNVLDTDRRVPVAGPTGDAKAPGDYLDSGANPAGVTSR
jgi:hypothetical protein